MHRTCMFLNNPTSDGHSFYIFGCLPLSLLSIHPVKETTVEEMIIKMSVVLSEYFKQCDKETKITCCGLVLMSEC